MAQELKELEGTWEEILTHSDELAGHYVQLKVTEPAQEKQQNELTLDETAKMMRVSFAYVVELVESGDLPSYLVGTERRVRRGDLVIYQEAYKREALAAFAEMAVEAQRMGLK